VQNVTTYGTVITVPNKQLKLKPGMTANVKIEIAKRTNALRIPNAALRFRPTNEMFAAFNQTPPPEATAFGGAGRGRGGRGEGGGPAPGASAPATTPAPTPAPAVPAPAPPAQARAQASASGREGAPQAPSAQAPPPEGGRGGGRGGGGFGGGRGGPGGGGPEFQARMMERFKTMSPDEQAQFVARMKERGGDTSAFEALLAPPARAPRAGAPRTPVTAQAQTIDALFAPLPPVESRGRAWTFTDRQLKPLQLRLGISDGTNTEVLGGELQENTEVVTGVTGLGPTRATPTQGGTGNPLRPGGGRGGPPGGGRPGGGGRGGN
jgi:HlyD family secretion protein